MHEPTLGSARRGFTLPELLVAISIVAFLLLAGVGVYWRMSRGFALRAAVSSAEAALRGARASAVHERSAAVVVLEPVPENPFDLVERLYALGKRTVSCWHFELDQIDGSKLKGALGQEAELEGVPATAPGRIGRSLSFDGAATSASVTSPYLDEIREGVFLEACVWPDADGLSAGARLPVVSKSDGSHSTFSLALRYQPTTSQGLFLLEGSVRAGGATFGARTDALIRAGEWAHVALDYVRDPGSQGGEGHAVVLRINGQEVELFDATLGNGALERNTAPLLIGKEGGERFKGRLDELKIAALVASDDFELPKNSEVRADPGSSDGRVHFDDEGKLDPRFHGRIARFRIVSPRDRLRQIVQVNWLGGVEVLPDERDVDQEPE